MSSYPVHLVCSSGGVKCFSYIGAIQKLKQHNITIASISTCSMGSVIGALVCSGLPMEKIEEIVLNFPFSIIKKKRFWFWLHLLKYPYSIYKKADYAKIVEQLIGWDMTLGELEIPFSAAALDIRQRTFLAYSSDKHNEMKISEVIKIATAIPPLAEPYSKDKRLLVDAAIASESPVWLAANFEGHYPILILKPTPLVEEVYKKGLSQFLATLFNASAASHDYFNISQVPRAIEININCGNLKAEDFNISKDQIERLILEGGTAVEKRLKDFDGNFNNILQIEEINKAEHIEDTNDRAVANAHQMMNKYHTEIKNRNQVFISYSRRDKKWLDKLHTYMRSIERFTGIKTWDDTQIEPGIRWEQEIERALKATKVAILLVSQNFFDSDFIQKKEMEYLLQIAQKENVAIIWVAVSACTYELTPLKDIQCANDPKQPLDQLSEAKQNAEFTKICRAIVKKMDASLSLNAT